MQNPSSKKSKPWAKIALCAIAILLAVMTLTNPSKQTHKEAIQAAVKEILDKRQDGNSAPLSQGLNKLGSLIVTQLTGVIVDEMVDVHNYGIFSVGKVRFDGETRTISCGVMGHVFTFDESDIQKAMEKQQDASSKHTDKEAEEAAQDG